LEEKEVEVLVQGYFGFVYFKSAVEEVLRCEKGQLKRLLRMRDNCDVNE